MQGESLVCFLSLPETQYIYLAWLAKKFGVTLDRYIACAIQHFNCLPDDTRMMYLYGEFDTLTVRDPSEYGLADDEIEDVGCDA